MPSTRDAGNSQFYVVPALVRGLGKSTSEKSQTFRCLSTTMARNLDVVGVISTPGGTEVLGRYRRAQFRTRERGER